MAQIYPGTVYDAGGGSNQAQYGQYGGQQQYGQYGGQQQYGQYGGQQQYATGPPQQPHSSTAYSYMGAPQHSQPYSYSSQQPNTQAYTYGPPYPSPYMNSQGSQQPYSNNPPGYDEPICAFTSKSIRLAFVRKVYAILSLQMLVTIGLMAIIIFVDPVRLWIQPRRYMVWIAIILTVVLLIVISCFTKPRRTFPLNVILLSIFTLAEAFLLGVISANRDTRYVLYSAAITLAIVIGITIFALQTKIDFTYLSGGLCIISIIFLVFALLVFFIRNRILNLVYCCIGVLLFSVFLLVDTQLMLGGNHAYSISPEDYIFAALNLYVDIVQIFLMVLGIFSNSE